jgi:hypothetical protein
MDAEPINRSNSRSTDCLRKQFKIRLNEIDQRLVNNNTNIKLELDEAGVDSLVENGLGARPLNKLIQHRE